MNALFFIIILIQNAMSFEIADTKIPDTMKCHGQELPLQAAGLRTATIFGIKVYVVALYAKEKLTDMNSIVRPVCYEISYLRDVDNEDTDKAWEFQFKESSEHNYSELKNHISILKSSFGEIKGDRKHVFALSDKQTDLYENGVLMGKIEGTDFQKSFLSVWYGENPPTKDVKSALLNGIK